MKTQTVTTFISYLSGLCLLLVAALDPTPVRALDIRKVTSPGGVSAWLSEDHTIPLIAMRFHFKGGSAADPADKAGPLISSVWNAG